MNVAIAITIVEEVLGEGEQYLPLLDAALSKGPLTGKLAALEPYRVEAEHVVSFFEWVDGLVRKLIPSSKT